MKRYFIRTSKVKFQSQIAQREQINRLLRRIRHRVEKAVGKPVKKKGKRAPRTERASTVGGEYMAYTSALEHHQMSMHNRDYVSIIKWLQPFAGDPAFNVRFY